MSTAPLSTFLDSGAQQEVYIIMYKEKYENTELEIIRFKTEDVIATSSKPDDPYELPE